VARLNSSFRRSVSIATSMHLDNDVEDLEMLLEAYFMQLDGIRNRILSVSPFIHINWHCCCSSGLLVL